MKTILLRAIGGIALLIFSTEVLPQANKLALSSFNMGAGVTGSPSHQIITSIGQPFVGDAFGGESQVTSGFLSYTSADSMPTSVESPEPGNIPATFELFQNYPNPFNPETTIAFALPRAANVKLTLYDVRGRVARVLVNRELPAGQHKVVLDASLLPSGIYFYQIKTEEFVKVRKLTLLK